MSLCLGPTTFQLEVNSLKVSLIIDGILAKRKEDNGQHHQDHGPGRTSGTPHNAQYSSLVPQCPGIVPDSAWILLRMHMEPAVS